VEGRAVHAEGLEDVLGHVGAEGGVVGAGDDFAGPVEPDAVGPGGAGFVEEGEEGYFVLWES
jgi:hypothetical protein